MPAPSPCRMSVGIVLSNVTDGTGRLGSLAGSTRPCVCYRVEIQRRDESTAAVVTRLTEIVFTQAVRTYWLCCPTQSTSRLMNVTTELSYGVLVTASLPGVRSTPGGPPAPVVAPIRSSRNGRRLDRDRAA
jgi:hypothetical protein